CLDQGIFDPADRAGHAHRRTGKTPAGRVPGTRARLATAGIARAHREDTEARRPYTSAGGSLRRQTPRAVSRPGTPACHRPRGRAETQGNLLHPRRRLCGRGTQACPLALIDEDMPVVAVAPNNDLLEKLKSNLQEVRARGGKLFVFADPRAGMRSEEGVTVIELPAAVSALQAPIAFAVPLQLLAYHVAVLKGTDVDQPRNLAKSLTVE